MSKSHTLTPNEATRIGPNMQVSLHFSVALEDGKLIDSTFDRDKPVTLTIGDGNLPDGFESVLIGLRSGDKRTALLTAKEAFGHWNPDNVQHFDKNHFSVLSNSQPQAGDVIEFQDKGKNTLPGVVKSVEDDHVIVDFNHPLAGKSIVFTVEVFNVSPPGHTPVKLF